MHRANTYIAYLKDLTQDTQFHKFNPQDGSYVKRGESVREFESNDLPMLRAYLTRLASVNKKLKFQIRIAGTGTVIWQT